MSNDLSIIINTLLILFVGLPTLGFIIHAAVQPKANEKPQMYLKKNR